MKGVDQNDGKLCGGKTLSVCEAVWRKKSRVDF